MEERGFYDVIIMGGGLAGLTCALHLSQTSVRILVIEKQSYPHHKVCGEYVSNEVLEYLKWLNIDPFDYGAKRISKFEISDTKGKLLQSELPLGGFGISRYAFDQILYEKARERVDFKFATVERVIYDNGNFTVTTKQKERFGASYVIGAYGKRSGIDTQMDRSFIRERSPWLGVKSHFEFDFPEDTVALHNFNGGYCGLSKTETNVVNACYLATYDSFKKYGDIEVFQKEVLSENPHLKELFSKGKPVFEKPLAISQISFSKKEPVEDHVFMIGDSAGLIHPLCGNGMAMAIHSARIFSELFLKARRKGKINRSELELDYGRKWKAVFSRRLYAGRIIQNLLLRPATASIGFRIAQAFPEIVPVLIKQTHGEAMA